MGVILPEWHEVSCEPSFLQAILERCCLSTRMRYPSQSTRPLILYMYRNEISYLLYMIPVQNVVRFRTGTRTRVNSYQYDLYRYDISYPYHVNTPLFECLNSLVQHVSNMCPIAEFTAAVLVRRQRGLRIWRGVVTNTPSYVRGRGWHRETGSVEPEQWHRGEATFKTCKQKHQEQTKRKARKVKR